MGWQTKIKKINKAMTKVRPRKRNQNIYLNQQSADGQSNTEYDYLSQNKQ